MLNLTLEPHQDIIREVEIPIELSGIEVLVMESNDLSVTLTVSINDAKMTFYQNDEKTILPDLTRGLRGVLVAENVPVIELRTIPVDEARTLILDYVKENHGAETSDIIFNLGLDVKLVLGILKELYEREEIIEVKS